MKYLITLFAILFTLPLPAHGGDYSGDEDLIGTVNSQTVKAGESLIELARLKDLGFNEITEANPDLDPFVPTPGATVTVPAAWIVPRAAEPGTIVVNLSEMRLYYRYRQEKSSLLATFPIGIGSEGNETPLGTCRVIGKQANPPWHVPPSLNKEKPWLPKVVPPGADNPLGSHALRLSAESLMIHGTNKPWGVGRRASHGCIRLYPEDIPRLYRLVSVGAPVAVVREPVKVGVKGGRVYIEVHRDDALKMNCLREAILLLADKSALDLINPVKLYEATLEKRGIPVDISK